MGERELECNRKDQHETRPIGVGPFFCLTFAGTVAGPLLCCSLSALGANYLAEGFEAKLGFILYGGVIALFPGFFLGTIGGYRLGKMIIKKTTRPTTHRGEVTVNRSDAESTN